MWMIVLACCALVLLTSFLHYEVLGLLQDRLPRVHLGRNRARLLVVILVAFVAHLAEIGLYAAAYQLLTASGDFGVLQPLTQPDFLSCFYFSVETFTSLGFGDLTPVGPIRVLAGVEALNGLLLIGWTASYTYLSMEQYWQARRRTPDRQHPH